MQRWPKVTAKNHEFKIEILHEDIGLSDLKVCSPEFKEKIKFKGKIYNHTYRCYLRRAFFVRTDNLKLTFYDLKPKDKNSLIQSLAKEFRERFTHIYKIIEWRRSMIAPTGYVRNYVMYMCHAVSKVYQE